MSLSSGTSLSFFLSLRKYGIRCQLFIRLVEISIYLYFSIYWYRCRKFIWQIFDSFLDCFSSDHAFFFLVAVVTVVPFHVRRY